MKCLNVEYRNELQENIELLIKEFSELKEHFSLTLEPTFNSMERDEFIDGKIVKSLYFASLSLKEKIKELKLDLTSFNSDLNLIHLENEKILADSHFIQNGSAGPTRRPQELCVGRHIY